MSELCDYDLVTVEPLKQWFISPQELDGGSQYISHDQNKISDAMQRGTGYARKAGTALSIDTNSNNLKSLLMINAPVLIRPANAPMVNCQQYENAFGENQIIAANVSKSVRQPNQRTPEWN